MNTSELINRSELIKDPGAFGLDLGKNPTSRLALYEREGLIPTTIKVGGTGRGNGLKAYYPAVVGQMIKEIQDLQKSATFKSIQEHFNSKYSLVYELYDVLALMYLRYRSKETLTYYLAESGIDKRAQTNLLSVLESTGGIKDMKLALLGVITEQTRKIDKTK